MRKIQTYFRLFKSKGENNMIQLHITKESDLYNPYDPSQTRIDDKVYNYLKSFCTELEAPKHLNDTLQIITDSPIDEDKFRVALQDAVKRDRDEDSFGADFFSRYESHRERCHDTDDRQSRYKAVEKPAGSVLRLQAGSDSNRGTSVNAGIVPDHVFGTGPAV